MIPYVNPKIVWLIVAGFCGSLVGLNLHRGKTLSYTEKFLYIFGGLCCSFFLAGPISKYFGLTDPGEIASVGFAVAIFWQQIIGKLSSTIEGFSLPFLGGDKK